MSDRRRRRPDGAKAAAFYGALLGWQLEQGDHGYHVANITPPGGIDATATEPGVTVFFRVDDVTVAAARVRELGGTVLEEATYPSGGNARCLDDQGVPFQLWQPAPGFDSGGRGGHDGPDDTVRRRGDRWAEHKPR